MTGTYVRVMRDGKPQSLEIDELTDEELAEFIVTLDERRARGWVEMLARWIRDNVKEEM